MTRFSIGTFTRLFKRAVVIGALLYSATETNVVQAEESHYKMRLHKNMIKNLMDKNFPVVLEHI